MQFILFHKLLLFELYIICQTRYFQQPFIKIFYFCYIEEFEAQAEARKNRNNKFTKENEVINRDKDITTVNFRDAATTV